MIRTMLAAVAMMSLMACDQLRQDADGADTVGRNLELASGATISVTLDQTITSRSNAAGETVMTTVEADVRDEAGRVVIPAGATVELAIVEIAPAGNRRQADGTLTLRVAGVTIRGQQYPLDAGVTSVAHTLEGRGVTAGEVEKVAAGTVIGAVAGRVIGGNAKGTIIGGAVGAAAGATVAIETASRDVVVAAGTPMVITLNGPLTVPAP
jgi:hypothetical protein